MRYPFVFYQKLDRQVYTISLGLARTEETPVLFREGKLLSCYPSLSNINKVVCQHPFWYTWSSCILPSDQHFQSWILRYSWLHLWLSAFQDFFSARTSMFEDSRFSMDEQDFTRLSTADKSTLAGHFHRGIFCRVSSQRGMGGPGIIRSSPRDSFLAGVTGTHEPRGKKTKREINETRNKESHLNEWNIPFERNAMTKTQKTKRKDVLEWKKRKRKRMYFSTSSLIRILYQRGIDGKGWLSRRARLVYGRLWDSTRGNEDFIRPLKRAQQMPWHVRSTDACRTPTATSTTGSRPSHRTASKFAFSARVRVSREVVSDTVPRGPTAVATLSRDVFIRSRKNTLSRLVVRGYLVGVGCRSNR